ncbi:MAG: BlaI/MecI/CopY family transcriptional regulator [Eubacterium sp.]|nr:BlaI/MecI/CopY family transcriptional regulator [Eubacterium sp.]
MLCENILSKSEKEVLSVIYDSAETLSLQGVQALVNKKYHHEWKQQTVSTFLRRAVKKGYLEDYQEGRHVFYSPVVEKSVALKNDLINLTYIYFNGDTDKMKKFVKTEL